MNNLKIYWLIIFILMVGGFGQLQAQEELAVGSRPMGFSGAFTAVADDANAIMWNPAGMAQLSRQELTTMRANLFNTGINQSYLGYVLPITTRISVGADWTALQFKDEELSYNKHRVHFAFAYRPVNSLFLGFNIKSQFSAMKLDDISEGETRRFDGDIGILFRLRKEIQLAFVLRDVANQNIDHEYHHQISHEAISARKGIAGIALKTPFPNFRISAETDVVLNERIRVG